MQKKRLRTNSNIVRDRAKETLLWGYDREEDLIANYEHCARDYSNMGNFNKAVQHLINSASLGVCNYPAMRECLRDWLEETQEEADMFSIQQVEDLYMKIMARALESWFKDRKYDYKAPLQEGSDNYWTKVRESRERRRNHAS